MIVKQILAATLILGLLASCSQPTYEFKAAVEPPAFPIGTKSTADSRVRMATRSYVASALKDIFGTSANATTERLVSSQVLAFGGEPCDPNADGCKEGGGASQLPLVPFASPMRMALTNRACQQIVEVDAAVMNAKAIARGQSQQSGLTPTREDILAAFDLFYVGRIASPAVIEDLQDLVGAAVAARISPIDQWRVLFGTLCESPGWQVP